MAAAWSEDGDALIASIQRSPFAAVISDPRQPCNPIIAANPSFCELTGYPPHEIIGRNCKFLAGAGTEPWLTERIGEGIRRREPVLVEIMNYKRDRTPFRNAVLVAPIFAPDAMASPNTNRPSEAPWVAGSTSPPVPGVWTNTPRKPPVG